MPQSMWFCSSTDCAAVTYHKKIISHGENVQFFFSFFFHGAADFFVGSKFSCSKWLMSKLRGNNGSPCVIGVKS